MITYRFVCDERLGIELPELRLEWEQYDERERSDILAYWEQERGRIPDRIKQFERIIITKQDQLNIEENFQISCHLNSEIAELASRITDLHIWYRVNQDFQENVAHA